MIKANVIYLALVDRARKISFYKLEDWQLETFIRFVADSPLDGFAWLWENWSSRWVPEIRSRHRGEPVFHYDMNRPESLGELVENWETTFPNEIGEDGEL